MVVSSIRIFLKVNRIIKFTQHRRRWMSTLVNEKRGLILGAFEKGEKEEGFLLTPTAQKYDAEVQGRLTELLKISGPTLKKGKSRIFYGVDQQYCCVNVVGLGSSTAGYNEQEEYDEKKENIRVAISVGTKQLRECGAVEIDVDTCDDSEAASEGGHLGLFSYDELKAKSSQKPIVTLRPFGNEGLDKWKIGMVKAEGQNIARRLMETPANIMTPTRFAEIAHNLLTPLGVQVIIRDKAWAESQKMGSYLSVAKGSDEPPKFVELSYDGAGPGVKHLALVGKGITFDSGGISIKPSLHMDLMRADMGGAACIIGAVYAVASLKIPINIVGLMPLCENLPSGHANKPGDVVTAMNGKTIQVDNTDAEGRLILADALCYAHTFNPQMIIDLATLTGAMDVALGSGATGVFTNSTKMWEIIHEAGKFTGDRMWRMPLFHHYSKQVTECHLADLCNIGKHGRSGGCCTAAAFLWEFVTMPQWMHLDIAGVMENKDECQYLCKGLAGRPTRTLVEFMSALARQS
ncbi:cytosol aminopeptidase-like isoform X1 [Centruroides sculpturatus]|uniref:cytosol aminopeptidase-like isoform X1 n=1 Tax=Centruroides sculpturatus TaxID=218467 RepID=UPI000C6D28DC|nr:cytosol aminopeptidase-like isoform X1 [Centruroides sculpturatus]